MKTGLREWRDAVVARVRTLGGDAASRYVADATHYRAVSERLEHSSGDAELARAGFLHGISAHEVRRSLGELVSPDVVEILQIFENFREFDLTHPSLSRELRAFVDEGDLFFRAGVLLVMDQLHHLDPNGVIAEWSRRFHMNTHNEPAQLPITPIHEDRFSSWDDERSFLFIRSVVAPIAQSRGMWHERNILEDAALLFSNRVEFEQTLDLASRASSARGGCYRFVAPVRQVLEPVGGTAIRWEWRHIAAVAERLRIRAEDRLSLDETLLECGFVTAVCREPNRCFEALGRLQCAFGYAAEGVEEVIRRTLTGYDAIHVNLQVPVSDAEGERVRPVRVKIIPLESADRRFAAWTRKGASVPDGSGSRPKDARIEVFAPDGRKISLPPGATVLHFAARLHTDLVVRLRGAQVNQRWVGPLHPLRTGDVVWIDTTPGPCALPQGWERHVSPHARRRIQKAYRKHYFPALRESGLLWIREALRERGIEGEMDDAEIERKIALCLNGFPHLPANLQNRDAGWWLEQMGALRAVLGGEEMPGWLVVGQLHRSQLLDRLASLPVREQQVPRRRRLGHAHFLLVDSRDRAGLVADVARVVADQKLSMAELIALPLPGGRGLIRLHIPSVDPRDLKRLTGAIRRVTGVTSVLDSRDRATHEEAKYFPPRRHSLVARPYQPTPYATGGEIRSDLNFYGMEQELADLHAYFDEAVAPGGTKGSSAFVCGPKKVGKTSLVLAFQRDLETGRRGACLVAHLEAAENEPWSAYAARLARKLFDAASDLAPARMKQADPDLNGRPLADFVRDVRRHMRMPVVLAIDEAMELCLSSARAGESEEILRFNAHALAEPGVLLVWVGPSASMRLLELRLLEMLRDAHRLPVQPLDRDAVAAMLRAEKMRSKYLINIDRTVIERIYRAGSGNPYWTGAIASNMWREAARSGTELVVFDQRLVRRGIEQTQGDDTFFADRYDVWGAEQNTQARAILMALARDSHRFRKRKRGADAATLLTVIRAAGLFSSEEEMLSLLRILVETGSLVEESYRGTITWRISAPLFASHLLTKLGHAYR